MSKYNFDPKPYAAQFLQIIEEVAVAPKWGKKHYQKMLARHPRDGNAIFSHDQIVQGYRYLVDAGLVKADQLVLDRIKMKPVRTISGVVPVTVLTKPFPCPGKCIFCPNDVRMPKSYLADEPGAQRAERNAFDPYLQVYNRLLALHNIGHSTEKVELIVLGGTWSFYPVEYQIWFVKRCFQAMNDFGVADRREEVQTNNIFEEAERVPGRDKAGRRKTYNQIVSEVAHGGGSGFISNSEKATWEELEAEHVRNESALSRCVGLVIETRPDYIDETEVIKIRRLGATKVQIGIQSLDDRVMELNRRGHGRAETERAIELLRMGGFKIHAHWMPNLYGSTVEGDIEDYKRLWEQSIRPDELKIYPTSIIAKTELEDRYKEGKFRPYSYDELLEVMTETMPLTPRYCRLTRVVRDIPSTDIVAGNKLTNFRQIAEGEINRRGEKCECIRCREIRNSKFETLNLSLEKLEYDSSTGKEIFLSYVTPDNKIVGFLRLALPDKKHSTNHFMSELEGAAIIREVHVYGQALKIDVDATDKPQHLGLGTKLIEEAKRIARSKNYPKLAVISAIGTRQYYAKKGFAEDGMYMSMLL